VATVRFVDGPCAGTSREITEQGGLAGTTTCGGETYHLVEGSVGVFFGWVKLPADLAAPPIPLSRPAHAWRRVVHQLVTETPRDLRRASATAQHLARIGRRG
jgi:hypothetical protein